MTSSFFTDVIKTIDNEYASLADDGISAGDVSSFIAVSYTHLTLPTSDLV